MKQRSDITLGEMQDECRRIKGHCTECAPDIHAMCDGMIGKRCNNSVCPIGWNLTDPPRFTEAQMEFWRGWYAIGAKFVKRRFGTGCVDFSLTTKDFCTSYPSVLPNDIAIQLEEGKVYDLAELLGKDGESK